MLQPDGFANLHIFQEITDCQSASMLQEGLFQHNNIATLSSSVPQHDKNPTLSFLGSIVQK